MRIGLSDKMRDVGTILTEEWDDASSDQHNTGVSLTCALTRYLNTTFDFIQMKQVTVGRAVTCTFVSLFSTVLKPRRSRWASNHLREPTGYKN
jgi:hypothetical protein